MLKTNQLSQNIKFLRKRMKISQQELANQLGIKRSNIAAYESKNIEPRLRVLLNMAKFFNIEFKMFLSQALSDQNELLPFKKQIDLNTKNQEEHFNIDLENVNKFINSSISSRKILIGFKSLQLLKSERQINGNTLKIKAFIEITEQLLIQNEHIIKSINSAKASNQS
jgi:transcriptional regulator with XRE-family HTH domain